MSRFAGSSPGAADAGTVAGTVYRTAAGKAKSGIDRYPSRSGASSAPETNVTAPAIVYLTGEAAGVFAPPVERPQMIQRDQNFQPTVMAILVGTTVDFPNLDPVYHNVFSYSKAKKFDLGRYP